MLLDLAMPVLGGFDVLDELDARGLGRFPIIAITANQELARLASPRVSAVLEKPFDIDELIATIAAVTGPEHAQGSTTPDVAPLT